MREKGREKISLERETDMDIDVPGTWVFGTLWKKSQIFLLS